MSPFLRQPLSPSADASVVGSLFSSPPVVAAVGDDRPAEAPAVGATLAAGAVLVLLGLLELPQAASPMVRPSAPIAMAMRAFFVIPLPWLVSLGT
jgi:hypothetical protein